MKVPKVIKLGSHEYEIFFDDFQEDKDWSGTFSSKKHIIFLNPHGHPQELRVTLIHELLHLIFRFNDITPSEQDVIGMSEALADILFRSFKIDLDFSSIPTLERREQGE